MKPQWPQCLKLLSKIQFLPFVLLPNIFRQCCLAQVILLLFAWSVCMYEYEVFLSPTATLQLWAVILIWALAPSKHLLFSLSFSLSCSNPRLGLTTCSNPTQNLHWHAEYNNICYSSVLLNTPLSFCPYKHWYDHSD